MRQRLARLFPAGSFARNVSVLTGGTVFAQGLAVLSLPLLTRLYSPDDFSLLAVYSAVIGIVTVVSCLRYNIAIPLPEEDADAMALLVLALGVGIGVSLLLALPVLFAPEATAALLGQPELEPYLWMIPLGVLFASTYNALQYWATRKKRFVLVTQTRVTRAIGGIGAQAGIGAVQASPFGLLFGHMLYSGLGVFGLLRDLLKRDRPALGGITGPRVLEQSRLYARFPVWSVPESLFNTAGVQLPLIMIAAMVAGPEAGFLFLAMRVTGLPMGLVGSSVSQVFLAEAPAKLRDGTLAAFTRRTMWALFKTGAPPLIAVGVLSPAVFPLVFGEDWARAGWLVAWMTPWFVLQFVASPVSMVMHVLGRQGLAMTLQAAGLVLRVGAVLIGSNLAVDLVSEIYAMSGAVFYVLYCGVLFKLIKYNFEHKAK
jgi:O-antigen/teichoic acid export membrane protein